MTYDTTGSDLTRLMLDNGKTRVWCAISDDSDEEAMMENEGNDFTAYIVSYDNGQFFCEGGMPWNHAVPIKIVAYAREAAEA